ncbi:MAG TPA: hypothetical protein PK778_02795 [Bacillota bacterium]|nr:hypothetical protein [Clostridiales bacterium]HPT84906.1 hypothetical protein [Bacillota bacterium]
MIHNILATPEEKETQKKRSIERFWRFANEHGAQAEIINGRLHLIISGKNLDAFCEEYKDDDIINLKLIGGRLCVEAKWLCQHAPDEDILAVQPKSEK